MIKRVTKGTSGFAVIACFLVIFIQTATAATYDWDAASISAVPFSILVTASWPLPTRLVAISQTGKTSMHKLRFMDKTRAIVTVIVGNTKYFGENDE